MNDLLVHAPRFSNLDARQFIWDIYNLEGIVNALPSERDQNFLVVTESDQRFVFKIANSLEDRSILDAQVCLLRHLEGYTSLCPHLVPTRQGMDIAEVTSPSGEKHLVRMVTYLPGKPLASIRRQSPGLMLNLGRRLAELDQAMASFDHPALHRYFHWDLVNGLQIVRDYKALISDPELCVLVDRFTRSYEEYTLPFLAELPRSIIHNDGNHYNILVGGGGDLFSLNQEVTGIIDFGDMVYSYTVGNLAVGIAYAILDKPDPLDQATLVVQGYNQVRQLDEQEIRALFGLVCMRLSMSVCIAAHQVQQQPENDYLHISQESIRKALPLLTTIHPRFAHAAFRQACGLSPSETTEKYMVWSMSKPDVGESILGLKTKQKPPFILNLGVDSPLIDGDERENTVLKLAPRLFTCMESNGAQVGIGRYNEARYCQAPNQSAPSTGINSEPRTIHLGVDLYAQPGTAVHAVLPGTIYAFHDNARTQDYGPVIILRHQLDDDLTFFTLYGHLSRDSLAGLKYGRVIAGGERIAAIGNSSENGGWVPHLHFQVITDLLDLECDFPGACHPNQRGVWQVFSPDPSILLGFSEGGLAVHPPTVAEILAARRERLGQNLSIAYRNPVKIVRGWMQYLYDETGRQYLDGYNNVPHVGHCHPQVVKAGQEQMAILNTNTRYLHELILHFAKELSLTMPEPLRVCYFVNSGSEANELALRLARSHTHQMDLIVLEAAYHGNTTSLIDISPYKHNGPGGTGAPDWVHSIPIPDTFRGPYKRDNPRAGELFASHCQQVIEQLSQKRAGLAGFIAESYPSVGGQVIPPQGYLSEVYRQIRVAGGVCIADEVQTGYGRIGTHFYAFESQNVVPDIVVLGKPIGNGHPIGAVITTPEIAASFHNGMEYFNTFGGNPVSCAIGLSVLDIVKRENLQEHARKVGEVMLEQLRPLKTRHELVGDVRGSGLYLGIELIRNRITLEPAAEEASFIVNRMRDYGILLGTDGPFHNVIKIRPPMPFNESDGLLLANRLAQILEDDFS